MKYEVTVGTLFIAGQKYRRGDVVELSEETAVQFGVRVQPVVEKKPEPKPNPGVARKTRSRKAAVAQGVSDENS